uniref:CFAP20 domain containing n=1 Tax=Malurus cyaneus samueli TaxID=2593467 RepID=A0A8C5TR94_9PASS
MNQRSWCNMCIDLVAFTSEIFRGAVFRSLDGIIISANCKLRKIFTLKSKPQDTAEGDGVPCEPADVIPQNCQLNSDVPQVTQLLNLTKIHKPEIKCRENTAKETGSFVNRGQGNILSSKTQDVSHIAFGSKILGPPPSSNRRGNAKVSGKVRRVKFQNCWHYFFTGISFLHCIPDPEIQIQKASVSGEADFQLTSPQVPSPDKNSPRRLSLKNAAKPTWEITSGMSSSQFTYLALKLYVSDNWVSPQRFTESIQLDGEERFEDTGDSACCNLPSALSASVEHHSRQTADHHRNKEEVFTFSSRPRSAPHGKSPNMSPESCVFPLDLEADINGEHEGAETEDSFEGIDSSEEVSPFVHITLDKTIPLNKMSQRNEYWKNKEHSKHNFEETELSKSQSSTMRKAESISFQRSLKPILSLSPIQSKSKYFRVIRNVSEETERCEGEYDRKKYQSNRLSSFELQMLASMKIQQNEELRDAGVSHGLSTSQIDSCNVSISTSSDDNAETWNSCSPPPVSQEHHYQKEMSPLSHSNPHNLFLLFPLHTGEDHLSSEEDEEYFTLLCNSYLNCYFDPKSGKYYELA